MKTERAVSRALARRETILRSPRLPEVSSHRVAWNYRQYAKGWSDALAWVLGRGTDPMLKGTK